MGIFTSNYFDFWFHHTAYRAAYDASFYICRRLLIFVVFGSFEVNIL